MSAPVPAHGTAPAPAAVSTDFQEVDAAAYTAAVATQQHATAIPPAAPAMVAERPAEPAGQHTADLIAEVDTELDRAAAEADPVREYPDGAVAVELEGADGRRGVIHVLAPDEWPSDANSAMHVGDFESWADGCLALDDYDEVWRDLCPNLRQVNQMFERFRELTGQASGKSLKSPRSLRRAARR